LPQPLPRAEAFGILLNTFRRRRGTVLTQPTSKPADGGGGTNHR
jgi:hypothetical protein